MFIKRCYTGVRCCTAFAYNKDNNKSTVLLPFCLSQIDGYTGHGKSAVPVKRRPFKNFFSHLACFRSAILATNMCNIC